MNPPMAISSQPDPNSMSMSIANHHPMQNGQYQEPPMHRHHPHAPPIYNHHQDGSRDHGHGHGHAPMTYPPPFVIGETEMVLPFVESQPDAGPFPTYHPSAPVGQVNPYHPAEQHPHVVSVDPASQHGNANNTADQTTHQYAGDISSGMTAPGSGGAPGMGTEEIYGQIDPSELWTRLQTFYEPTPAYWGQSVGNDGFHGGHPHGYSQGQGHGHVAAHAGQMTQM